MASYWWRRSFI